VTSPTTFDDGGDGLLRSTERFFGGIAMETDPLDRQSQRIPANPAILHAQVWIRLAS
jgi:hypothetical protein